MRIAIVVGVAVSIVATTAARAEPCKDSETCAAACSARDLRACTRAAEDFFEGKHGASFDPKRSLALAKTACDGGDAYGCALLGYHYQDGSGTPWDPGKAVAAYTKGCASGSGVACYNLGGMYGGGHGVDLDPAKYDQLTARAAVAWRKQCEGTETRWCSNLGFVDEGRKDLAAAAKNYDRGCKHGDPIACAQLARVEVTRKAITPAAFVDAVDKLCSDGEVVACAMLSSFLGDGASGVTVDKPRAVSLAVRACEGGDAGSCAVAALRYGTGEGIAKDLDAADRLMQRACEHRYSRACTVLADQRIRRSHKAEAQDFAQRGCEMANADACELLLGIKLALNAPDTVRWAREACRQGKLGGCDVLIDRDVPLPLPDKLRAKVYREACNVGRNAACKHSK